MAAIDFAFSPVHRLDNGSTLGVSFDIAASNSKAYVIFQAREAATITRLGFLYSRSTGTPPTYRISLQGVSSGKPDGTVLGGGSPASTTFTPPSGSSWNNTWRWLALDNSVAVTRGQLLAWVIDYSSGTINGSNSGGFCHEMVMEDWFNGWPYPGRTTAGTDSIIENRAPVWGYGSAGTPYGRPIQTQLAVTLRQNTTPNEIGIKFQLPASWGGTYTCRGVKMSQNIAIAADIHFNLYDVDGTTVLNSMVLPANDIPQGAVNLQRFLWQDANLAALVPGNWYRIGMQPQASVASHSFNGIQLASSADQAAFENAALWSYTSRTVGNAWTEDATRVPFMAPIIADYTPVSAGGLIPVGICGGFE